MLNELRKVKSVHWKKIFILRILKTEGISTLEYFMVAAKAVMNIRFFFFFFNF